MRGDSRVYFGVQIAVFGIGVGKRCFVGRGRFGIEVVAVRKGC